MPVSHRRRATRTGVFVATSLTAVLAVLGGPNASANLPAERAQHKATVLKVRVPHSFYGVHDKYLSSLSRPSTGSLRLWDSGTFWSTIEPSPGTWNWAPLDAAVEAAHTDGTAVLLTLGLSPSYAAAKPTDAPDLTMYHDYVQAVMQRYSPANWHDEQGNHYRGIGAYQVWNESNISTFWTGTPAQLAEMTKTVFDVRNQVDLGALVVSPAMVTRLKFEQKAAQAFYETDVPSSGQPVSTYVDVISLNLYPTPTVATSTGGTRPATPEDSMALLSSMRGMLAQANVSPSIPVWNTEINYGMGASATTVPISVDRQVAYVMRTYILNAAQGVRRVNWYAYDMGTLPTGGTLGNTLLTDPDERAAGILTPAGVAFTRVQNWLNGTMIGTTTKQPCIPDENGTYTCLIKYANGVGRIYWNPYQSARVRLVNSASKKIDEYGASTKVTGGTKLKVNYMPVLVKSKQ
jgi:hypothetical protein